MQPTCGHPLWMGMKFNNILNSVNLQVNYLVNFRKFDNFNELYHLITRIITVFRPHSVISRRDPPSRILLVHRRSK